MSLFNDKINEILEKTDLDANESDVTANMDSAEKSSSKNLSYGENDFILSWTLLKNNSLTSTKDDESAESPQPLPDNDIDIWL